MQELLKLADVMRLLNVSEATVHRMVKSGKLPAVKLTRAVRYKLEDVEKFIADSMK